MVVVVTSGAAVKWATADEVVVVVVVVVGGARVARALARPGRENTSHDAAPKKKMAVVRACSRSICPNSAP